MKKIFLTLLLSLGILPYISSNGFQIQVINPVSAAHAHGCADDVEETKDGKSLGVTASFELPGCNHTNNSEYGYYCPICGMYVAGKAVLVKPGMTGKKPTPQPDPTKPIGYCKSCGSLPCICNTTTIWDNFIYRCTGYLEVTVTGTTGLGLTSFSFPDGIGMGNVICFIRGIGASAFRNHTAVQEAILPGGITSIGSNAFSGCTALSQITMGNDVKTLGSNAFSGCTRLNGIELSFKMTTIGASAFRNCTSLTSIVVPSKVSSLGSYAFKGCTSLTSVELPNSLTRLETEVFCGCRNLTSINIPENLTVVGSGAFSGCAKITELVLPKTVTEMQYAVFSGCSSLTELTILNPDVPESGESTFSGFDCSQCTLYVPYGSANAYRAAEGWQDFDIVELPNTNTGDDLIPGLKDDPVLPIFPDFPVKPIKH